MNVMKELVAKPLLAAALLSALACSSEVADAAPEAQQNPPVEEAAETKTESKFNFAIPGDEPGGASGSGGFNFTIPDDETAPSEGGLGQVALPDDGSSDALPDFEVDLAEPAQ